MIDTAAMLSWPMLAAQLLMFGTAAFALLMDRQGALKPARTVWRVLATIDLAISPLLFLEIAARMAQTTWIGVVPMVLQIMRETLAGRVWMWRFVVIVMLALVAWIPARRFLTAFGVMLLSVIAITLGSLTSHAIDKGILVIAIDALHQAAAGLWFGALLSLLMSSASGAEVLEQLTPRVSAMCTWAVATMVISGVLTAFQWLGCDLHLMLDSAYGRILMWKVSLAGPALMLGAYNRYSMVPDVGRASVRLRLVRTVAVECLLLVGAIGWSAVLSNTPPPH